MTLHIKDETADRLARELAKTTGESITEAVTKALAERLERQAGESAEARIARLDEIARACAALPVLDDRSPDEILGYNKIGAWDDAR